MAPSYTLGLNPGFGGFNYHDPAAALICDMEVLAAAEEERFNRVKASPGIFPAASVAFCLSVGEIDVSNLAAIAIGYSVKRWSERLGLELTRCITSAAVDDIQRRALAGRTVSPKEASKAIDDLVAQLAELNERSHLWVDEHTASMRIKHKLGIQSNSIPFDFVDHHLAHAASAYYPSGFEDATVVVVDGVGGVSSSSVWLVRNGEFSRQAEVLLPNSLGYFYAAITDFLGMDAWEGEGKVMALAPYGERDPQIDDALRELSGIGDGTSFDVRSFISQALGNGFMLDVTKTSILLSRALEVPKRSPDDELLPVHRNIAWSAQTILEQALLSTVTRAIEMTGVQNLCVAGGVFLNCKANLAIRESGVPKQFYVQPVAKDSGLALGAAWHSSWIRNENSERPKLHSLSLGFSVSKVETVHHLQQIGLSFSDLKGDLRRVAQIIVQGEIVAWYNGRAEFGPRALGNRSILADPRDPHMRDRVNSAIKQREPWRPFAPSILEECADSVLSSKLPPCCEQFMVEAYEVSESWRDKLPAVMHPVDYTIRPHTVSRLVNPEFHALLTAFHETTGIPLLLNTSLNGRGEPIINSLDDLVRFFYSTPIRCMFVNGLLVVK